MKQRKGINWFAIFMFLVLAYFGTVLVSQQVHLAHVSDSQYLADKRLEKAQAENEKLRKEYEALEPEFSIMQAMIDARTSEGLTQRELSVRSGIAQGDISKMERGNANPSLNTLQKLATAMGKSLRIDFL